VRKLRKKVNKHIMQSMKTRWPFILSMLLLSVVLAACGGQRTQRHESAMHQPSVQTAQQDAAQPSARRGDTTVNVVAQDFSFTLDAAQVNAGTITFVVQNKGSMPHDFAIEGNGVDQKTAMIQPGQSGSLTVNLQPGIYIYVCTVPGHAILGMRGELTVN
jgi:uncharacterized cupredoxin-like copper-binding protein